MEFERLPRTVAVLLALSASPALAQPSGNGELTASDPTLDNGAHYDDLTFEASPGQVYDLTVTSAAFDPVVTVIAPNSKPFKESPGPSSGTAELSFTTNKAGTWTLRVSESKPAEGPYSVALVPRE